MSVFQVQLTPSNLETGIASDPAVSGGVSLQRTIDVPGPDLIQRRLYDGMTFSSSNYWKRYATIANGGTLPNVDPSNITYGTTEFINTSAFIVVLSDDGSVWDPSNPGGAVSTYVWTFPLILGTTYTTAGNFLNIMTTYGGYANFAQITITGGSTGIDSPKLKINGNANAIMNVSSAAVQIFNPGDIEIPSLAFDNSSSGANTCQQVQVVYSVKLIPTD